MQKNGGAFKEGQAWRVIKDYYGKLHSCFIGRMEK